MYRRYVLTVLEVPSVPTMVPHLDSPLEVLAGLVNKLGTVVGTGGT